jgi:hypothetical protein
MRTSFCVWLLTAVVALADLEPQQAVRTRVPRIQPLRAAGALAVDPGDYGVVRDVKSVAIRPATYRRVAESGDLDIQPTGYGDLLESRDVRTGVWNSAPLTEQASVRQAVDSYVELREVALQKGHIPELVYAGTESPLSFWRHHRLKRPEDSTAWDDELRGRDVPNSFEQSAFPWTNKLKLLALKAWQLPLVTDEDGMRGLREKLLSQKQFGYNGVILEYRTDMGSERVVHMLDVATEHFETILLAVIAAPPYPSPADFKSDLVTLLGRGDVDAVISGYGKTIDIMGAFVSNPDYRESKRGQSTRYYSRWVDRECAARGIPVFGFVWPNVHGGGLFGKKGRVDYAHAPTGMAGYLLGNIQPRGAWTMTLDRARLKELVDELPQEKPVILGPFFRQMRGRSITEEQLERRVRIYHSHGYGVIKHL